tara:strand:+ start:1342 stop:1680 length:339 start_codon:yes stop_codon:yes gene_type:complete
MATETPAQMAARFRKMAQDPNLPQAVKNTYLDKANEVEKAAAKPTMAKGGMAMPSTNKPTTKDSMKPTTKAPMKAPMKGAKMPVAIMIAVGKQKEKMSKGGAVKPMAKKGSK